MVAMKSIICFAALIASACAALTGRKTREFLPSDITGEYSLFVKQGTCAPTVQFKSFTNKAPGVYAVPHNQILEDGAVCSGDGEFTILTKDAIIESGNEEIFNMRPVDGIIQELSNQGATFMLGYEKTGRECGPASTPAKSVAVFVDEETKILIPGLITLFPGAKYMVVYDSSSPTPCTYFAQHDDRVIGIAATPTPTPTTAPAMAPAVVATPVPAEEEPSASMEAMEETGVSAGAAAGAAAAGAAAAGAATAATISDDVEEDDEIIGESFEPSSSPEDGEDDDDGSACFPADATVELEDGSIKTMEALELGDRVKVASGKFSPVFMFSHRMGTVSYNFVRLTTASGESLTLTKGHYLYVNGQMAAAESVRVGDSVETETGLISVSAIDSVVSRGLYNPQTVSGDIIVNGVKASTYTTAVETKTAHSLLLPLRAAFRFAGMTTSVLDNGADRLANMLPSGGLVM
eukprot:TRINITY_DN842_c0_g1_i1.p4 TRINITY_DN842_c0_g1~~TRINITY_DN842_c0_g1_i1.p4  ORF type:complete len:464 (-),score=100.27 TRINITY_DN842_c0_g1_i1:11428-12819(-)